MPDVTERFQPDLFSREVFASVSLPSRYETISIPTCPNQGRGDFMCALNNVDALLEALPPFVCRHDAHTREALSSGADSPISPRVVPPGHRDFVRSPALSRSERCTLVNKCEILNERLNHPKVVEQLASFINGGIEHRSCRPRTERCYSPSEGWTTTGTDQIWFAEVLQNEN